MQYKNPTDDVLEMYVDGERTLIPARGNVEVHGEQAKSLADQGWTRMDKPPSEKAKPARKPAENLPPEPGATPVRTDNEGE